MPYQPKYAEKRKLPRFSSADKGLEQALNLLAEAIEGIVVPNINVSGGNIAWSENGVMLTPPQPVQAITEEDHPWKPEYTWDDGDLYVSFQLGTLNNVVPTNWNAKHELTMTEDDVFHFIVLTVTSDNGGVSSIVISLEETAPETDMVSVDIPPTEFKVVLGAVGRTRYYMAEKTSLTFVPTEMFKETQTAPAVGAEPFYRWYAWQKSYYVGY